MCLFTPFRDATTSLIAEKKMTSPVWRGARGPAHCSQASHARSLAQCKYSGLRGQISLSSKLL